MKRFIAFLICLVATVQGGDIYVDENHHGNKVNGLPTPATSDAAATKGYVDSSIGSGFVPTSRTISTTSPLAGGGDLSTNRTFSISLATTSTNGYLSSTDWNIFNNKQSTLTLGNLTDVGTDGVTVTGGTGAVVGSGTSLSQHVSDTTHNGYLSSVDWNTFNGKSTVTPAALTKVDDTNVTLTLGGTPTTALLQAASITAGWTGTLSQSRGGFGKSTASTTDGQIPIGKTSDGSWNVNTLTAGTGISVTNGAGAITITNTGITSNDVSDTAFASSWNGVTTIAPSKNAVYDEIHLFDTADDGTIINAGTGFRIGGAAASGKILVGNGTNFVASTPTFPNASATSGKTIRSDGTNWIASTATLSDAPSTSLKWMRSDGTNWITSTSTLSDSPSTAGKVVVSDGTNWITSTPTFPNASATSRKMIVSDGTNWVASTETYAVPGSSGNVLTSDGTNWTSAAPAGGSVSDTAYASSWNGVTTIAPSKNAVYDWGHTFDTDDNGKVNVLDLAAGIPKTDSGGVLSLATADTDYTTPTGTETLTNKRVTKRALSTSGPGGTPTLNTDTYDVAHFTAIAAAITSMTTNLSGTPVQGDQLRIDFTDDGTARAITWGASFEAGAVPLPTTTVISTRLDTIFYWNTVTSKWRSMGSSGSPTFPATAGTVNKVMQSDGTNWLSQFLVGTTTNDNSPAGGVGEETQSLIASGSAVSLTTATAANVTNVSLTAGDWDVEGNINFTETTSTVTARSAGINTTSATIPTDGSEAFCGVQSTVTSETNSITLPRKRISIASTTTVYLVAKATFSAGTCTGFGAITARRVR